ncbi:MAG: hypothetical protein ACRDRH_01240 [Pseudonocardia sp.]
MRKKIKESPSPLRSGEGHALCLPVTTPSSPVYLVRELTCSGTEPDLDLAESNVDTGGVDQGVAFGVIALESAEEGKHACLLTLIHRNVSGAGR